MADRSLNAGFTGDLDEEQDLPAKAKAVVARAQDEAGMTAAYAVDHPVATGSALLAASLLGLAVGYLLGQSSGRRSAFRI